MAELSKPGAWCWAADAQKAASEISELVARNKRS